MSWLMRLGRRRVFDVNDRPVSCSVIMFTHLMIWNVAHNKGAKQENCTCSRVSVALEDPAGPGQEWAEVGWPDACWLRAGYQSSYVIIQHRQPQQYVTRVLTDVHTTCGRKANLWKMQKFWSERYAYNQGKDKLDSKWTRGILLVMKQAVLCI